jgi:hypothetical protein
MISGKTVLGAVAVGVGIVVYAVHIQQIREREEMHKGVIKDRERALAKKLLKEELEKGR